MGKPAAGAEHSLVGDVPLLLCRRDGEAEEFLHRPVVIGESRGHGGCPFPIALGALPPLFEVPQLPTLHPVLHPGYLYTNSPATFARTDAFRITSSLGVPS